MNLPLHFPSHQRIAPRAWASLPSGVALRPAQDSDLPWLRTLYASTREAELTMVSWTDAAKAAFLNSQFELQHRHYMACYPQGQWHIVLGSPLLAPDSIAESVSEPLPIGRLYVAQANALLWVVDIALLPTWRGQGLGSALLRRVQQQATEQGLAVGLHVGRHNHSALQMYQRLGFKVVQNNDTHWCMHWQAPASANPAPTATGGRLTGA